MGVCIVARVVTVVGGLLNLTNTKWFNTYLFRSGSCWCIFFLLLLCSGIVRKIKLRNLKYFVSFLIELVVASFVEVSLSSLFLCVTRHFSWFAFWIKRWQFVILYSCCISWRMYIIAKSVIMLCHEHVFTNTVRHCDFKLSLNLIIIYGQTIQY